MTSSAAAHAENVDLPVSVNQECFLLIEEWQRLRQGGPHSRHVCMAFDVSPRCSIDALQRAINTIAFRHAPLRTSFKPSSDVTQQQVEAMAGLFARTSLFFPGMFRQHIAPDSRLTLEERQVGDVAFLPANVEVTRLLHAFLQMPFDRTAPPLMRGLMLTAPPQRRLIVSCHPLVFDWWSRSVFASELAVLLAHDGHIGQLPPLRTTYEHFVRWQKEQLVYKALDRSLAFWRAKWLKCEGWQLRASDFDPALQDVHEDGPRGGHRLTLARETFERACAAARRNGVTPYALFLTAFAIALAGRVVKRQLAFWINFSNRTLPGTDRLIGQFSHPHLVEFDFTGNPTGQDLMRHTQRTVAQALPHQQMPINLLWSSIGRSLEVRERRIVFDVLEQRGGSVGACQENISEVPIFNPMSLHLLSLRVLNTPGHVSVNVGYSRRHFSQEAISSIVGDFVRGLEALTQCGGNETSSYLA